MAQLNENSGSIVAYCPGCQGARSTFEWRSAEREFGELTHRIDDRTLLTYRLFRCAGCGRGGLGIVKYWGRGDTRYPGRNNELVSFVPETKYRLPVPDTVPEGIRNEFREAEKCYSNGCLRAAAGLLRSVLDKTMRANGYNTRQAANLYSQIEAAANEGVITQARKQRAHDEVRVLGNDVLHDDWVQIAEEDVEASRHYTQRILEDFYDDRDSVLMLLRAANRVPLEDQQP